MKRPPGSRLEALDAEKSGFLLRLTPCPSNLSEEEQEDGEV